ncbi:hypothetical protein GCM10010319_06990 [Streptomyces blastmyceticus]|uniref:Uncharacterized protein n=1 Tax=Streptomyces blastmyceticus TaxID=68180 RepID=A0ABN0WDN3_9ACTN
MQVPIMAKYQWRRRAYTLPPYDRTLRGAKGRTPIMASNPGVRPSGRS